MKYLISSIILILSAIGTTIYGAVLAFKVHFIYGVICLLVPGAGLVVGVASYLGFNLL